LKRFVLRVKVMKFHRSKIFAIPTPGTSTTETVNQFKFPVPPSVLLSDIILIDIITKLILAATRAKLLLPAG
jgi:hypothetical protein